MPSGSVTTRKKVIESPVDLALVGPAAELGLTVNDSICGALESDSESDSESDPQLVIRSMVSARMENSWILVFMPLIRVQPVKLTGMGPISCCAANILV